MVVVIFTAIVAMIVALFKELGPYNVKVKCEEKHEVFKVFFISPYYNQESQKK